MLGSAAAPFPSAEKSIHPHLGYPLAFAKLCHNNPGLFPDTPPHCFLPYSLSAHSAAKLRELDSLFQSDAMYEEKDDSTLRVHSDFLWSQLDHLGNAGFDPAKFRVDPYGNVLHRNADPSSPLGWVIDHWFPQSRGGKTRMENLRLVQWQVAQCKGQRLEFLVPWWDLQLGISVNQFLSVFASKNTEFRRRAFSLLFHCNNGNYSELESHYWPQHFKQKAKQDGLAAAAVVKIRKHKHYQYESDTTVCKAVGTPIGQQWGSEDEEALLIALQKYNRPVEWVEGDKQCSNLPDMEKVQSNNGCEEELKLRHSSASSCIQQGKEAGEILGFKIQQTKEQVARLEKELKVIKQQNEKEKAALDELENLLEKHKTRVEKQRRWSETQLHYRQCLERIIRDTLHQNSVFKEKARLNQAACTALLAKIQSQRMNCEDAELDLAKQSKEREALEILAQPNLMEYICRRLVEEGFLNNKWSIMDQEVSDKVLEIDNSHIEKRTNTYAPEDSAQKMALSYTQVNESLSKPPLKCMDTILEEDEQREVDESHSQILKSPLKRKVTSGEFDVHVGNAHQRQKVERISQVSKVDQNSPLHSENASPTKLREDRQLDELLQEVLTLKDESNDVASGEENEENRITRLGKVNVDKWLQKLLLNDISKQFVAVDDDVDKGPAEEEMSNTHLDQFLAAPNHDELASICTIATGERPKKGLGGLFRRMGFSRHDAKKLRVLKEKVDSALEDARLEELATIPCYTQCNKVDYTEERRSIKLERVEADCVRPDGLEVHSNEEEDATPSELEFVKRMRELREIDKVKQSKRITRLSNAERPAEEVRVHAPLHQRQTHHPDKLQNNVKEAKLAGALNNPNDISNVTCLSSNTIPDRLTRSYSMRATSSGGRWVLHTRKGSDVFPSTMEGDPMGEEVEIVLQSSSSFRREYAGCESHCIGASGGGSSGFGSMGLKASLKTCTKAWKRVVSKRSSNSQGTIK